MLADSDECWHILIRLPNNLLYDGGNGVHNEDFYDSRFIIEDMSQYDINLLEKRAYGLDREYSRYCPNFSLDTIEHLINKYLNLIIKSKIDE